MVVQQYLNAPSKMKSEFLLLKTVAFIAGKKNSADQNFYIRFSIKNLIAIISLYALSGPKLNFGCYLTFEIHFLSFISMEKRI